MVEARARARSGARRTPRGWQSGVAAREMTPVQLRARRYRGDRPEAPIGAPAIPVACARCHRCISGISGRTGRSLPPAHPSRRGGPSARVGSAGVAERAGQQRAGGRRDRPRGRRARARGRARMADRARPLEGQCRSRARSRVAARSGRAGGGRRYRHRSEVAQLPVARRLQQLRVAVAEVPGRIGRGLGQRCEPDDAAKPVEGEGRRGRCTTSRAGTQARHGSDGTGRSAAPGGSRVALRANIPR